MRISDWSADVCSSDLAGWTGPLHRCTFYGNRQVGEKLNAMLTMGASRPWPDALEAFTGSREMDGTAMIAYFQPPIGRASCRERVWQYVKVLLGAGAIQKKKAY